MIFKLKELRLFCGHFSSVPTKIFVFLKNILNWTGDRSDLRMVNSPVFNKFIKKTKKPRTGIHFHKQQRILYLPIFRMEFLIDTSIIQHIKI